MRTLVALALSVLMVATACGERSPRAGAVAGAADPATRHRLRCEPWTPILEGLDGFTLIGGTRVSLDLRLKLAPVAMAGRAGDLLVVASSGRRSGEEARRLATALLDPKNFRVDSFAAEPREGSLRCVLEAGESAIDLALDFDLGIIGIGLAIPNQHVLLGLSETGMAAFAWLRSLPLDRGR